MTPLVGKGSHGNASNAVNGIYEKHAYECAASNPVGNFPEFTVDLGVDVTIHYIRITSGVCATFDVLVVDSMDAFHACKRGVNVNGYSMNRFSCQSALSGSKVVVSSTTSPLLLCEVEVFGDC